MSIKRILYPLVYRRNANRLFRVADVVSALQAELTLMRVLDPFRDGGPKPLEELHKLPIRSLSPGRFRCHVDAHPDPVRSIADYALENKIDLIMVPPEQPGWLQRVLPWRSLRRRILSESPCPVWMLDGQRSEQPVRRILCGVTGGDVALVKSAHGIAKALNARLYLVHVVPDLHEMESALGYDLNTRVALSTSKAVELLSNLQQHAGTNVQQIVETGKLTNTLRRTARALNADLIITGRGRVAKELKGKLIEPRSTGPALWSMPCQTLAI
jgi:nucleotide-binding universal stress UspA family protein